MSRTHPPTEATPLVPPSEADRDEVSPLGRSWFPPIPRVLFTSFLLAMTFAFTQTSLVYAFRTMTCDDYYSTRDMPVEGYGGDRCAIHRIEADTAASVSLMSALTASSMILNLFVTGWWIKVYGVKAAMFQQTIWAALRNLTQIYALHHGGRNGIRIIQSTQTINMLGSASGYQLAANAFVAALAIPEKRTGLFGVLGGAVMLGSSAGYTFGGLTDYYFGSIAPFYVTFGLLVSVTIFGALFLPYLPPDHLASTPAAGSGSTSSDIQEKKKQSFLAPLKLFIPHRKIDEDGRLRRDWSLFLLGAGAFFSVLATAYVPMGLQLVATNVFAFRPAESGFMLSLTLLVKAFFLSICFPFIIHQGRHWLSSTPPSPSHNHLQATLDEGATDDRPDTPLQAEEVGVTTDPHQDIPRTPTDIPHGSTFDLYFLRYSILLDGLLTAGVSFAHRGEHMYLAAAILPFASGTGAACKGVTLDFVGSAQRSDALSAIALIEKLAAVSAVGIFGAIFAALSEVGKPTVVFLVNAAVAFLGFLLLLLVRMPKSGQIALS